MRKFISLNWCSDSAILAGLRIACYWGQDSSWKKHTILDLQWNPIFILSRSLIPIFEVDIMFASEVSSKVNTVKINRKRFKFAFAPRVLFMRESGAALPNYGRLMRVWVIYVSVQRMVCWSHQLDRLGYVSRTNQIAALGYVSRTNQSVVFALWFKRCSNFAKVMGNSVRAVSKFQSSFRMRNVGFSVFSTCILPRFMRSVILLDRWKISDYP